MSEEQKAKIRMQNQIKWAKGDVSKIALQLATAEQEIPNSHRARSLRNELRLAKDQLTKLQESYEKRFILPELLDRQTNEVAE